jgi:hypothetical protein
MSTTDSFRDGEYKQYSPSNLIDFNFSSFLAPHSLNSTKHEKAETKSKCWTGLYSFFCFMPFSHNSSNRHGTENIKIKNKKLHLNQNFKLFIFPLYLSSDFISSAAGVSQANTIIKEHDNFPQKMYVGIFLTPHIVFM